MPIFQSTITNKYIFIDIASVSIRNDLKHVNLLLFHYFIIKKYLKKIKLHRTLIMTLNDTIEQLITRDVL